MSENLWKMNMNFSTLPIHLSVQNNTPPTWHVHEILYWGKLLKFVMNVQVCLILDKNIMHFTRPKNFWCCSQLNNTRQNSLLHFHGNTFNISILFRCKVYSSNGQHVSNYIDLNRHKMLISVLNIKVTCEWHKAIKLNYKYTRTTVVFVLRFPSNLRRPQLMSYLTKVTA